MPSDCKEFIGGQGNIFCQIWWSLRLEGDGGLGWRLRQTEKKNKGGKRLVAGKLIFLYLYT